MLALSGFNGFGQFAVDGQRSGNAFTGAEMLIFFAGVFGLVIWKFYMFYRYIIGEVNDRRTKYFTCRNQLELHCLCYRKSAKATWLLVWHT